MSKYNKKSTIFLYLCIMWTLIYTKEGIFALHHHIYIVKYQIELTWQTCTA